MARRSTYDARREDLARLFYDTTRDEMDLFAEPRTNDIAARAVLADALEERGMTDLAQRLRRFPTRERFISSLLREKVRRAIFGPEKRASYAPRKPATEVLLAYVLPQGGWVEITHDLYEGNGPGTYLFHTAFDGRYLVRGAWSAEDALDAARERWPNTFGEEDDEYGFTVYRVARSRRARVVDRHRAFIPDAGVVEHQ